MTTSKIPISGLVITYNEEKNIAALLENIDFVDEIVIVDSFSKDKTKEIALQNPKVRFIENPFADFTTQRNFALRHATHDWILFLDGDERVTPELKQEILDTVALSDPKDAYFFYRKFIYKNEVVHFSGTQTDKNFRLFKKSKAHYAQEKLVHETLVVDGTIGILKHKLLHYSFDDYLTYKNKMISYGKLKAQELLRKGKKAALWQIFLKPVYKFLYSYLIRLGILDGAKGITVCYLQALSVYITYKELKKLHK